MRAPGALPPAEQRWVETLDALAASITTGEPVDLPDDLGPLPPHLVEQATLVLARPRGRDRAVTAERDRNRRPAHGAAPLPGRRVPRSHPPSAARASAPCSEGAARTGRRIGHWAQFNPHRGEPSMSGATPPM